MFRMAARSVPNHGTFSLLRTIALLCTLVLIPGAESQGESQGESVAAIGKPNIVLILVDDMGYGDPGCYNPNSKIPTPHIDSLARDGMRFTDAHASGPLCHLSRYGLMTGRYPFRAKVGVWSRQAVIDADRLTLPKMLQKQGYRTAMVGKWHLGFDENGYDNPLPGGPIDRGFDSYYGIRASTDIPPYFYIRNDRAVEPPNNRIEANNSRGWSPIQGAFWRAGGIASNLKLKDVLPKFTDEAVTVITDHAKSNQRSDSTPLATEAKPMFLYLAYPAPHTPWLPAKEYLGRSKASMYGDFTCMVDSMIGRVLQALRAAKMEDNTIVIFSSDNGPVWYETDVKRFDHDSVGGLRGMKADAWEGGHRMPFVVRWPDKVKPGSTSDQLLSFTDVMATLGAITGATLPKGAGPDSIDFSAALYGKTTSNQRATLALKSGGGMMTFRQDNWKLIAGLGSGGFSKPRRVKSAANGPQGQLYDLSADLAESNNLYLKRPDIVNKLKQQLQLVVKATQTRP